MLAVDGFGTNCVVVFGTMVMMRSDLPRLHTCFAVGCSNDSPQNHQIRKFSIAEENF